MTDELFVRPYVPGDWDAVCAVHDRARPVELAGAVDPRAFKPMNEVAGTEEFFESQTLVACIGERVVAFVSWRDAYITWLYVDPAHMRRGIGSRLLAEALARIGPQAWVNALAGNEAALALYRKAGFDVVKSMASDCEGYPCTTLRLALPTSRMHDPSKQRASPAVER